MQYLFSLTGDAWFDEFKDQEKAGYGFFVDKNQEVVLVTHGSADGHLPCIDRHNQWALLAQADKVACCYPAAVKRRFPSLNVVGDWDEISWIVTLGNGVLVRVEMLSATEYAQCYTEN